LRDTIYWVVKHFEETGPEFTDGSMTSGVYLSKMSDVSVPFLMAYGLQPGFNKMVPDLTPAMPYFTFFMTFSRTESCQTSILCYVRKNFHGHQSHCTYTLATIFYGEHLK
jgi:hypothetical protein